jgi:hypothetical protein
MRRFAVLVVLLGALVVLGTLFASGCSSSESRPKLTEHQRDSVLSKSSLPGAGAVGGAMKAADKEAAHAAQVDSLTN